MSGPWAGHNPADDGATGRLTLLRSRADWVGGIWYNENADWIGPLFGSKSYDNQ